MGLVGSGLAGGGSGTCTCVHAQPQPRVFSLIGMPSSDAKADMMLASYSEEGVHGPQYGLPPTQPGHVGTGLEWEYVVPCGEKVQCKFPSGPPQITCIYQGLDGPIKVCPPLQLFMVCHTQFIFSFWLGLAAGQGAAGRRACSEPA